MIADREAMVVQSRVEFLRGEPAVRLFMVAEEGGLRCELNLPQRLYAEADKARRGTKIRLTVEIVEE